MIGMLSSGKVMVHVEEPGPEETMDDDQPPVTHVIGPSKHTLLTSQQSSVFLAEMEPSGGPVRKLTFLQIGTPYAPDISLYEQTCQVVEFNGPVAGINAAFDIICSMPSVEQVTFFMKTFQKEYFPSAVNYPISPTVKKLQVFMDFESFYSTQHQSCNESNVYQCSRGNCLSNLQHTVVRRVEIIMAHAKHNFPNLTSLIVELPNNQRLYDSVKAVVLASPGLKFGKQLDYQGFTNGSSDYLPPKEVNYCQYKYEESDNSDSDIKTNAEDEESDQRGRLYPSSQLNSFPATMDLETTAAATPSTSTDSDAVAMAQKQADLLDAINRWLNIDNLL